MNMNTNNNNNKNKSNNKSNISSITDPRKVFLLLLLWLDLGFEAWPKLNNKTTHF